MSRSSRSLFRIFAVLPCILASLGVAATTRAQSAAPALKLLQTIPLPGIDGAMDHMDMDVRGQRLFIPAEQAGLVEVVDAKNGKRLSTISAVRWPSTVAYHPQSDEIFVSDREDGSVKVISGKTYELVKTIQLTKGADNATYDPDTQYFYVAYAGRNAGMAYTLIGVIDTNSKEHIGDIRVDAANIQAMAVEPGTGPKKMYADIADKHQIAVIDLQKRTVLKTWPTTPECQGPYAATLDSAHHRLFVGCRMYPTQSQWWMPGKMMVMNTDTGEMVAIFEAVGGSDEMYFDPASQRVYLQGYEGIADVWKEIDPNHYEMIGKIQGGVHGKTSLLVPELKRYYVTVSRHQDIVFGVQGGKMEEGYVEIYEVQP